MSQLQSNTFASITVPIKLVLAIVFGAFYRNVVYPGVEKIMFIPPLFSLVSALVALQLMGASAQIHATKTPDKEVSLHGRIASQFRACPTGASSQACDARQTAPTHHHWERNAPGCTGTVFSQAPSSSHTGSSA